MRVYHPRLAAPIDWCFNALDRLSYQLTLVGVLVLYVGAFALLGLIALAVFS